MRTSALLRGVIAASLAVSLTACGSAGPGTETASGGGDIQVWAIQDAAVNPIAAKSIDAYNNQAPRSSWRPARPRCT
nr:hypothetical protein GCM10020063_059930 [Dactylosporangium thailandense]